MLPFLWKVILLISLINLSLADNPQSSSTGNPIVDTCAINPEAIIRQIPPSKVNSNNVDYECLDKSCTFPDDQAKMFFDGFQQKWLCDSPSCAGDAKMAQVKEVSGLYWQCVSPSCQKMTSICDFLEGECSQRYYVCKNYWQDPTSGYGSEYKACDNHSGYLVWNKESKAWQCPLSKKSEFSSWITITSILLVVTIIFAVGTVLYRRRKAAQLKENLSASLSNETYV